MNLPAHGTTSPNPSIAPLLKRNTHASHSLQDYRLTALGAAPGKTNPDRLAEPLADPLFYNHHLAEHTLPPGATLCRDLSYCSYHLVGISRPPGTIPEAFCCWFWDALW
ncbi:hypothetical protein DEO72_LG10g1719 [Vigna unguiculata]|uniref:Uncharacterized protein n=1 Tax=Vigna unguiculata TaxID=3917 RepID=A0A4D6ND78_VIGUN|nr:hypothetical protein DEO72_LG10g1719 [Vigna unguiculata]